MSSKKSLNQRETETFESRIRTAFGGMTLKDIAERLNENPSSFWNWAKERTDMPNKVLAKIAIETNYSLNWILTGQGEKFLAEEKKISIDEVFENRMREIFWQEFAKGAVNEKIQGVFFALQPNIRKHESQEISLEHEILKTGT